MNRGLLDHALRTHCQINESLVTGRQWRWATASGSLSQYPPPGTQSGWEKSQVIKAVVTSCGFAFGLSWVEVPAPPLIGYVASVS